MFAFQVPGVPEWLIQQNLKDFVKNVFQGHAIRKTAFPSELTKVYQEALAKPGVLSAAMSYYRQLLSPGTWLSHWGRSPDPVTVPTLVLWGEEDSFLSHKLTEGLDRLIQAPFTLKLIPDCGHWVQQEAPHTVNRELLNFLRSKRQRLSGNGR